MEADAPPPLALAMRILSLALLALALAGCASAPRATDPAARDVVVDGVSLLGVWDAIGALDDPEEDADLRSGLLIETLTINPRGRATLSGEDRRAETGHVSLQGRVRGREIRFEGLPGAGRLAVREDGRLVLTNPSGQRTLYQRRR